VTSQQQLRLKMSKLIQKTCRPPSRFQLEFRMRKMKKLKNQ